MSTGGETYRAYTNAQGDSYAAGRPGYAPALFTSIIDHHMDTGGQLDTVVDVGCGTGQATLDLCPYFAKAIGLDPSEGMIKSARASAKSASSSAQFDVSAGEDIGSDLKPPIADGSIDLLTAATAAHWFDMARFWASAARTVKAGGTVALWARTAMTIDPEKTPNGTAIRAVVDEVDRELMPFDRRGSILTRDLYVDLPLPWTLDTPVEGFDKASLVRREWNKAREYYEADQKEDLGLGATVTAEQFASLVNTNSSVIRWREAHPEKAGTEEDLVASMKSQIERLLAEAGEDPGARVLKGGVAMVLLMIKKL